MGQTLGEAVVKIEGDLSGLSASFQTAKQIATVETSKIQQIINSQFKSAGGGFTSQLKTRMAEMQDFRDNIREQLNQQKVGQHPDFLNSLLPADFSKQLQQRMEKAASVAQAESDRLRSIIAGIAGRGTIAAILAFAITRTFNAITEAHKVFRESAKGTKDYIALWAESIPIFGKVVTSFRSMYNEITGVTAAMERFVKAKELVAGLGGIRVGLERSIQMLGKTPEEKAELTAINEYKDTIIEIEKIEEGINKVKKENAAIEEKIAGLVKQQQGIFAGDKNEGKSPDKMVRMLALQKQIDNLKEQLTVLPADSSVSRGDAKKLLEGQLKDIRGAGLEAINEDLKKQIATYGMTASQIKVYEARLLDANSAKTKEIELNAKTLDQLDADKKKREELAKAMEEAAKKSEEAFRKITDRAKEIFESTRTPMEKFKAQWAELNQLMFFGFIDLETYKRALKAAMPEISAFAKSVKEYLIPDKDRPAHQLEEYRKELAKSFWAGEISAEEMTGAYYKKQKELKPKVTQQIGFSGFKEMWSTIAMGLLKSKPEYEKEIAKNTKDTVTEIKKIGTVGA